MMTIETVSVVIAATSVVFGILTWVHQNRENAKTNQARLLIEIFHEYTEPKLIKPWAEINNDWRWTDFEDFWEKYVRDPSERLKFFTVLGYCESMALLVHLGLIDTEIVSKWMPINILGLWERIRPLARQPLPATSTEIE